MRDAVVYDCQVKAHKTFFDEKLPSGFKPLPKEKWPSSMPKDWIGIVYNITGFSGQQVVALLSFIVNDKDQFKKGKTFYLLICRSTEDELEELFRVIANPLPQQPGNAIVFLRPKGKKRFQRGCAKSYEELNGALEASYGKLDDKGNFDTTSFARDLKKLFENNKQIDDIPQPTIEAYMLLLFEIARRLVKIENPGEKKEAFDVLPIGSAIARLINLLELREDTFEQVFLPKEKFHCFTGKPKDRRKAIEEINVAIEEINVETMNTKYKKETPDTVGLSKEEVKEIETNRQLQELREMFCSEEEKLSQTLNDLKMRISQETSSQSSRSLSTSNAECTTVFEHLE